MIFINPSPTVPFKTDVNLMEKKKFIIKGRPLQDVERFHINFQRGEAFDAVNIAFHFDVRFRYGEDVHVIVMNYKKRGKWYQEERIYNFPFSEKEQFTIEILVDGDMYTVDVNKEEVAQFRHQMPLQIVDHLAIEGDVFLDEVELM